MDYQYEADNIAQMNIYWIVMYSFFMLLGTYVCSRVMQTVRRLFLFVRMSQSSNPFVFRSKKRLLLFIKLLVEMRTLFC